MWKCSRGPHLWRNPHPVLVSLTSLTFPREVLSCILRRRREAVPRCNSPESRAYTVASGRFATILLGEFFFPASGLTRSPRTAGVAELCRSDAHVPTPSSTRSVSPSIFRVSTVFGGSNWGRRRRWSALLPPPGQSSCSGSETRTHQAFFDAYMDREGPVEEFQHQPGDAIGASLPIDPSAPLAPSGFRGSELGAVGSRPGRWQGRKRSGEGTNAKLQSSLPRWSLPSTPTAGHPPLPPPPPHAQPSLPGGSLVVAREPPTRFSCRSLLLFQDQETPECRVCRGESELGRRLYAPCLCSGSIMYVPPGLVFGRRYLGVMTSVGSMVLLSEHLPRESSTFPESRCRGGRMQYSRGVGRSRAAGAHSLLTRARCSSRA